MLRSERCIVTPVMSALAIFLLASAILTGYPARSAAQAFMTETGYAEFESRAPLLTFKGTSDHLTGLIDLEKNLVDFYLDLNTIDTGIRLRNRHMRESYLETDKFPFAEFTGSLVSGFDPDSDAEQQVVAEGIFQIHGVERETRVEGTLQRTADGLLLSAGWMVLLDDHNIRRPRVVFYELAEEQVVTIRALLRPVSD
jgi:polyisoprenoid-binding protein YceI